RNGLPQTYQTIFSYDNNSNYGDFHNPYLVKEVGQLTRTTKRTFEHSAGAPSSAPYIVAKLKKEEVRLSDNDPFIIELSRLYNMSDGGFMYSETKYGLTTTFVNDGRGNIASLTKPNGKITGFDYRYGRLRQVITPAAVNTTMEINPDGTVASRTFGG